VTSSSDLSIGIDIGGTKILGGVVDSHGTIIDSERRDTPTEDGRKTISEIAAVVKNLSSRHPVSEVGVSIAGFMSKDRKRMETNPNISNLEGIEIHDELEQATGLAVHLENDGNSAAWGEFKFGAGKGSNPMLMVTVGTGIGGGLIIDSKLLIGAFGTAGEVGHAVCVDASSNMHQETLCAGMCVEQSNRHRLVAQQFWLKVMVQLLESRELTSLLLPAKVIR
jgi:glucokinase